MFLFLLGLCRTMLTARALVSRFRAGSRRDPAEDHMNSMETTAEVIDWLAPRRLKIIKKHLREMGDELDKVMKEAKAKFSDYDEGTLMEEIRRREAPLRKSLQ